MDRPPACYFASVQDGKQEIYLEWPNGRSQAGHRNVSVQLVNDRFKLWEGLPAVIIT